MTLPPEAGEYMPVPVSPRLTRIASGDRPRTSAVTIAIAVRVPPPMSCVPQMHSTVPSEWMITLASAFGPPYIGQTAVPMPKPRRTAPRAAAAAAGERRRSQPIALAAVSYIWRSALAGLSV